MKTKRSFLLFLLLIPVPALASTVRETVEETEKRAQMEFCSKKSHADALSSCRAWLTEQKGNLKERLLLSTCSQRPGGDIKGCLHKVRGELRYILRKSTRETND